VSCLEISLFTRYSMNYCARNQPKTFQGFQEMTAASHFLLHQKYWISMGYMCIWKQLSCSNYYHDNLPNFGNFFVTTEGIINCHSFKTQMVSKTHVEVKGTNYDKFSMKHRGAILLNSLPNDLDNVKSYSTQKFIKTSYIFSINYHIW